jgi:plastocyanin
MSPLPRLLLLAACAMPIALAGCGDDGPAAGRAPGPNTVVMDDYEFHPRDLRVRSGQSVIVLNEGGTAHNLTIERGPDATRETDELAGTVSFLRGGSEVLRLDLPPGRYAMVCTVPGHRELGMTGTLEVR